MRTTYVVLVLTMMSAASSYGFDLGISGGIRDWEDTSRADERFTPEGTLTIGQTLTPKSALRVEGLVAAWTHETNDRSYDLHGYLERYRRVERSGFAFGARFILDNRILRPNGGRLVRPYVGAGIRWATDKSEAITFFGNQGETYWNEQWVGELLVGIAIPTTRTADFLIQYSPSGDIRFREGDIDTHEWIHSLSLGYRFAVWGER